MTALEKYLRGRAREWVELSAGENVPEKIEKLLDRLNKEYTAETVRAVAAGQAQIIEGIEADITIHNGALHIAVWLGEYDVPIEDLRFDLAKAFAELTDESFGMDPGPESVALLDAFLERAQSVRDEFAKRIPPPARPITNLIDDQ